LAAQQAIWMVTHLTLQESEDGFTLLGNMAPSNSSVDRLPKQLNLDQEGNGLDILVQRRDKAAAKKFLRTLLKELTYLTRVIVTDKLKS
jgi:putative transposase